MIKANNNLFQSFEFIMIPDQKVFKLLTNYLTSPKNNNTILDCLP